MRSVTYNVTNVKIFFILSKIFFQIYLKLDYWERKFRTIINFPANRISLIIVLHIPTYCATFVKAKELM